MSLLLTAAATIAGGVWLDSLGHLWSQIAADVLAWSALGWILWKADAAERNRLGICLVIATLGEYFLSFVWGIYTYRFGNLPLFVPPGHALVYTAGWRLVRFAPRWLPAALAVVLAPVCIWSAIAGWDTQAPIWYAFLLVFLFRGPNRLFYATMFLFALGLEAYGTVMGTWCYLPREPWFGLSTLTKPPLWAGVLYCTLDSLVLLAGRLPMVWAATRRSQTGRLAGGQGTALNLSSFWGNSRQGIRSRTAP